MVSPAEKVPVLADSSEEEARSETLAETVRNDGLSPESDVAMQLEEDIKEWELAEKRIKDCERTEEVSSGPSPVKLPSPTLLVDVKVFDEGIPKDKQDVSQSSDCSASHSLPEAWTGMKQIRPPKMTRKLKDFQQSLEINGCFGVQCCLLSCPLYLARDFALGSLLRQNAWPGSEWFGPGRCTLAFPPCVGTGFLGGIDKDVLSVPWQFKFDASSIETWEQIGEMYNELRMKFQAIPFDKSELTDDSDVIVGRIVGTPPVELLAPPGNNGPGGSATAPGRVYRNLGNRTRRRRPPESALRRYFQRLSTYFDVEYFQSNVNPSAHELASAGHYLDGSRLTCCGCGKRHPRGRLVCKDPRSNEFHLSNCVFSRPRPLCSLCVQTPVAASPSDVGRCVQCHHDCQVRAFTSISSIPEYVLPDHNPRAFVIQHCVIQGCGRRICPRLEQDVCVRCSGVVCDLCVSQQRYHGH